MGLNSPKSSLGLMAGTVAFLHWDTEAACGTELHVALRLHVAGTALPPLIASDGTEPWGNIQRLAVAVACLTVVSLADTIQNRQPVRTTQIYWAW